MAANTEYTKIKESTISAFFSKLKAAFWPKADVTNITLADVAVTGDYDDLTNKPTIPPGVVVDQTYDGTSTNAQSGVAMAGALAGKQDTISDLSAIRTGAAAGATAVQPEAGKGLFSGNYNDLSNKPTIPDAQVQANWNESDSASKAYIQNKPTIPDAVEANPTVPAGTTPPDLQNLKVGSNYFAIPQGGASVDLSDTPIFEGSVPVDDTVDPSNLSEQLGEPITEEEHAYRVPEYTLTNYYYISESGIITSGYLYAYSSPIRLLAGETLNFSFTGGGQAAISLTNENGTSYLMVVAGGEGVDRKNKSYTATEDCYVAVCGMINGGNYVDITSVKEKKFIDAEQVVTLAEETSVTPEYTTTSGKFIDAGTNTIKTNANYLYTSPIFLNAGDVLEFDFSGGDGTLTLAKVIVADGYYEELRKDTAVVTSITHVTYTAPEGCRVAMTGTYVGNVKITHPSAVQTVIPITELLRMIDDSTRNDFKDEEYFEIPIPTMAKINIVASGMSTSKTTPVAAMLEYEDLYHNIKFKRNVTLTAQGSSSMNYIEKNQTVDFSDCTIKFGHWVAQDSFHLKAYYIDVFRGINNAMYNYVEDVIRKQGCRSNRVLKSGTPTTSNGTGDFFTDFGTDALCHPDGFQVEVYLNGEYFGLFALNLKKHRDNYSMNKNDEDQILLDGQLGTATFWGGTIDWTAFEIRNPKGLICMDGSDYDGDNPAELIDSTSASYDSSNAKHVFSAAVKTNIQTLASAKGTISALSTTEAKKAAFEAAFDVPMFIVYYVISQTIDHYDGFHKNWIWTMYDGYAAPNFYDMDSLFGRYWNGSNVFHQPNYGSVENYSDSNSISHLFVNLYSTEIAALYGTFRSSGIITVDNIVGYLDRWLERIGRTALERNLEAWPKTPSYRPVAGTNYDDGTATTWGMYDTPERIRLWLTGRIAYLDNLYGYNA